MTNNNKQRNGFGPILKALEVVLPKSAPALVIIGAAVYTIVSGYVGLEKRMTLQEWGFKTHVTNCCEDMKRLTKIVEGIKEEQGEIKKHQLEIFRLLERIEKEKR